MKPETLNGTVLGTCTLQHILNRGGMGIVYLAQQTKQTNPPRQVAVTVLSLTQTATQEQRRLFLERFRRDMKVVATLTHPSIVPVYESGEGPGRDEMAYIAQPYYAHGTLKDVLAKEGRLAWPTIVAYLEQAAAALDYAHESGVLHQNITPACMLLNGDGNLLVTDFGLVSILMEGLTPQERLLGTTGPAILPDYMAPEQLTGEPVDGRTDIYSLGVLLYQMITGTTPFQGESPIYIAAQQVQVSPPLPRSLRPDLPVAAEQALLRAMAKQAANRYTRAQEFSSAFRAALLAAGIALPDAAPLTTLDAQNIQNIPLPAPQETPTPEKAARSEVSSQPTGNIPMWSTRLRNNQKPGLMRPGGMGTIPATPARGLLSSARPAPVTDEQTGAVAGAGMMGFNGAETRETLEKPEKPQTPVMDMPTLPGRTSPLTAPGVTRVLPEMQQTMPGMAGTTGMMGSTGAFGTIGEAGTQPLAAQSALSRNPLSPFPPMGVTGAWQIAGGKAGNAGNTGTTTTIKLTDAVKVVQVPVAGQPGRYMTGFLPVLGDAASVTPAEEQKPLEKLLTTFKNDPKQRLKMIGIVALVALVLFGSIAALLVHARSSSAPTKRVTQHIMATPNYTATAAAQATATADANIILQDPLTENIHNWPNTKVGTKLYFFSSDGYHIADNDSQQSAPAILPGENISGSMAYTLTMREIKGNDGSLSNTFGMILRFSNYKKGNQMVTTFYVFEVLNMKGGQYQFWRYDSSQANHWISIWKHNFGSEFHQGHSASSVNTVKIIASGKSFSFTVNSKGVGNAQDGTIASGEIGMLVNLQGTEVAFSNLLLTHS